MPRKRRTKTKKLVAIVRVSRVGKRAGESFISPELQLEGMRDWLGAHPDYELPEHLILREMDVSGARPLAQRPGLSRAVDLVESGEAEGGIWIRLDRLARDPAVFSELKRRVRKAGGVVIATDHGGVRGDLPEEELHDDMSQSFAKYEVARARRAFGLAREKAVARGVVLTAPPVGYDKIRTADDPRGLKGKLVPNRDAPAIREAFKLRAGGASVNDVAAYLDRQGVRSVAGRSRYTTSWSRAGVTRLLKSRTYLGEIRAGDLLNPHAHEPLVDEALFLAAQKSSERTFSRRESAYPFWLTKVARCAGCGAALIGDHVTNGAKKYPFYRCTTRGCAAQATISASRLERFVEDVMRARTPDLCEVDDQPADDEGDALEAEKGEAERELEAWRRLPVADLDPTFFADGLRERRERLDSVLEKIGQREHARPVRPLTIDLWRDWETMPIEEKRTIVRDALARVEVRRGAQTVPLEQRIAVTFAE
jgi:DNA invertase Pin-like site-specific DNA recombinase